MNVYCFVLSIYLIEKIKSLTLRLFRVCILLTFISFFSVNNARTAHIVGGEIVYRCLGMNADQSQFQVEITFTLYRDKFTTGADFDPNAILGIYRGGGSNWTYVGVETPPKGTESDIEIIDDPCVDTPNNIAVEKAPYVATVWLDVISESYQIAYQRCCRNGSIFNIQDPGSTGVAYTVEITPESQQSCNSSPVFNEFPPVFICAGLDLEFDHSATDTENDVLVYSFCAPLTSGGTDGATTPGDPNSCTGVTPAPQNCLPPYDLVSFVQPAYSPTNPMGGDPVISIDPATGIITGVPTVIGQYVVGVCATEFRNGVKIGEIRRDFQFNVTTCTPLVVADISNDVVLGGQEYLINSCGETEIFFENLSYEEENIDGNIWSFDVDGDGVDETSTDWDATFTFPGVGEYFGTLILNPGQGVCSDTATIYLNIYPAITADYDFSYDTCVAGPVSFIDKSFTGADNITNWTWDFSGEGVKSEQSPEFLFTQPGDKDVRLIVEDNNGCQDTLDQQVEWYPAPPLIIIEPSSFIGCAPANIFFNNLSSPIDSTYDINWDFGDGQFGDEISPFHVYDEVGSYSVNIEITTPIGCRIEQTFHNWIRIEPSPEANFSFTPENPSNFNPLIQFYDESIGADTWQWNMGGEATFFQPDPSYTFKDTGTYEIQLIVLHPSGCPDTIVQLIDIEPRVTFFLPNAFSPNQDGTNDTFIGTGYYDGLGDYSMTVWNRWGEQVFESDDPYIGWNGTKNNVGQDSPTGVYVYVVSYRGPRGQKQELRGHTTLIR